ncbi:MAG TPA: alpha/beta fold hydrolase [Acidobacteriota bacterium]|jgi:hypothetical protein
MKRWLVLIFAGLSVGWILVCAVAGIFMAEGALHPKHRPISAEAQRRAEELAKSAGVPIRTVRVSAADGVPLVGWYFSNQQLNQNSNPEWRRDVVLILHGQSDNRAGALSFARLFLRREFDVLLPDSRAHGESGGEIATYGFLEGRDVSSWIDWLVTENRPRHIYALGESMGAAILLRTLCRDARLDAVIAEAPFCNFREVAFDRVGQQFRSGNWVGRILFRPAVEVGFVYARLKYGADLGQVAPEECVTQTRTKILMIHGDDDHNIPLRHCLRISGRSKNVELWRVPGAGHTEVFGRQPTQFEQRVCRWLGHP